MSVKLRRRTFETTYNKDGERNLKRVNSYETDSEGNYLYKKDSKGVLKKVKRQVKKPSYRYYLDVNPKGSKRTNQFLDIWVYFDDSSTEKERKKLLAESICANVQADLISKDYSLVLPKYKSEADFLTYCDKYLSLYPNKDRRKVAGAISHFKSYLKLRHNAQTLAMTRFKPLIAQGFVKYLKKDSGLSGETPLAYLKKIKAITKEAVLKDFITSDPFKGIDTQGLNKSSDNDLAKEILTIEEQRQLYNAQCNNEFVYKASIWAIYTGMGLAEIKTLKWSQINLKRRELTYTRAKTGQQVKGLHLHQALDKILFGLDRSQELVFGQYRIPSGNGINKSIKTWVKNAGIDKHITFYCWRHTFGTNALRTSKNLKAVADLMGQKSTKYTEIYARVLDDEKTETVINMVDISQSEVGS